jgi:hypothetical protein
MQIQTGANGANTDVDSSPAMIAMFRARFPDQEAVVADRAVTVAEMISASVMGWKRASAAVRRAALSSSP